MKEIGDETTKSLCTFVCPQKKISVSARNFIVRSFTIRYKDVVKVSQIKRTAFGGITLAFGWTPNLRNLSLYGCNHLYNMRRDTPAQSASWMWVIALYFAIISFAI